jgi:hypothetical protein
MKNNELVICANIDWFSTVDDVDDISDLPNIFEKLYNSKELSDDDLFIANSFLKCRFVSDNYYDWEEYLDNSTDGEFESDDTRIVGLDFKNRCLPSARAEAFLRLKLKDGVSIEDFEIWMEDSGSLLSDGIVFYWDLSSIDKLEDLDFTQEEHLGLEVTITA